MESRLRCPHKTFLSNLMILTFSHKLAKFIDIHVYNKFKSISMIAM